MPSVITLEGQGLGKQAQRSKQAQLFGEGDSAFMAWMHKQNILVAGGVALGLSLTIGLAVSTVFVHFYDKLRKSAAR